VGVEASERLEKEAGYITEYLNKREQTMNINNNNNNDNNKIVF